MHPHPAGRVSRRARAAVWQGEGGERVPPGAARRLLLQAQGLADDPARRATRAEVLRVVRALGFVQLDSINTVERAHHLTLASRLHGYRPAHFAHLCERQRALFEQWTHDAAAIPVEWFAHWKPRFARARERIRKSAWWRQQIGEHPDALLDEVRQRVTCEGALRSQDFEDPRGKRGAGWWDWKPHKAALEYLFHTGELAVARREGFEKVFDLAERIFPQQAALPEPSRDEHVAWACSTALDRLGVATAREVSQFWSAVEPSEALAWCEGAVRAGRLANVLAPGLGAGKAVPAYASADWRARLGRMAELPRTTRLLSPFDPVLRDRARTQRYFGFDYRFEAFTPAPKRQYGYYVLPVLEGERLVGRIDPKHHRDRGALEVRKVFWEPGVRPTRARLKGLADALALLAAAIGATSVEWGPGAAGGKT